MKTCENCGQSITHYGVKFCSRSCSAKVNNRKYPKRGDGIPRRCATCNEVVHKSNAKYCSTTCHKQKQYEEYIDGWKFGSESGGSPNSVSTYVKRYLRETRGDLCEQCGWHERNPVTDRVPLEIHHIGDHNNHREDNLLQLCPNCHSLTPTFRALNRGSGRMYRRK